nr:MAG TPA: hypothetical protein [Caudoviricetes sp.]
MLLMGMMVLDQKVIARMDWSFLMTKWTTTNSRSS